MALTLLPASQRRFCYHYSKAVRSSRIRAQPTIACATASSALTIRTANCLQPGTAVNSQAASKTLPMGSTSPAAPIRQAGRYSRAGKSLLNLLDLNQAATEDKMHINIQNIRVIDIVNYLTEDEVCELAEYLDITTGDATATLETPALVVESLMDLVGDGIIPETKYSDLIDYLSAARDQNDLFVRFPS